MTLTLVKQTEMHLTTECQTKHSSSSKRLIWGPFHKEMFSHFTCPLEVIFNHHTMGCVQFSCVFFQFCIVTFPNGTTTDLNSRSSAGTYPQVPLTSNPHDSESDASTQTFLQPQQVLLQNLFTLPLSQVMTSWKERALHSIMKVKSVHANVFASTSGLCTASCHRPDLIHVKKNLVSHEPQESIFN